MFFFFWLMNSFVDCFGEDAYGKKEIFFLRTRIN